MVNTKGNTNGSPSTPSLKNDSAKTAVSPMKTNLEETAVVSETEEKVEQILEEVKTKENAMKLSRTDRNASEEENNAVNAGEENNEENAEKGTDEENSQEEEEEEGEGEEEENNDKDAMEEEIAEENNKEERNAKNAEVGKNDENYEEEENDKDEMEEEIAEENTKEQRNEEKTEASSKEKVIKSRKRSRNKVAPSDSEAIAFKDKDKPESSGEKTPSKKAKTIANKPESSAKETPSKKAKMVQTKLETAGKKRLSKKTKMVEEKPGSSGKKMLVKKAKTVTTKNKDEPESSAKRKPSKEAKTATAKDKDKAESSGKKKPSKKAESMGMIFMCSSKTKKDCYRYKVLGLPASKKDLVQKIYKGMRLFLYDVDLKLMYGIFKAAGPGGFDIEPKAFNSAFPSQVRFTVLEECLPLGEEKFKKVIKENYYSRTKFDCKLNSEQVKNLCKLFASASKGTPKSKKAAGRSVRAETRPSAGRGQIRRWVSAESRPRSPRGSRRRALDESRPRSPAPARRYMDRPIHYEREAFVSPMANPPRAHPVPPPSYAYGRTVEMDAYGRDPPLEHRGRPYLDFEPTRRDEIGSRDRYIYREREPLSYRDPVYSAPEYNYDPPVQYNYVPPPALPSRYRYADSVSDYRSSAGVPTDYHTPAAGLRNEYRSSARDRVYRL
ncbi:hypothetical protein LguiA_020948 [Lonicera macranthoides]